MKHNRRDWTTLKKKNKNEMRWQKRKQGPLRPPRWKWKENRNKKSQERKAILTRRKYVKKKKYSFPWSWQSMRISQLSLKQIDNDEHMRANGKARAKIELRVYVLKRADCCECKGRKIWSRDRENTHSHIHILVVMKTSQTRWNGRQTWG